MSQLRARATTHQPARDNLVGHEPEAPATTPQAAPSEASRPTGLRKVQKDPLESPECASPLGILTRVLKDERLQNDPLVEQIRETLGQVKSDHIFYPYPEAHPTYLPLLADLTAHPNSDPALKDEIQASTDAFRLMNPLVQKRILFPYATKMADIFQAVEPYQAERPSSHPRFSTYMAVSLRDHGRASASVDLHPKAAEVLNASLLVIDHDKAFFEAIEGDVADTLYANYNLISGSRLVAAFEPGTIRAALVAAGAITNADEAPVRLHHRRQRPEAPWPA